MTTIDYEHLSVPVKPETKQKVSDKAEELGISKAGYARMILKDNLD